MATTTNSPSQSNPSRNKPRQPNPSSEQHKSSSTQHQNPRVHNPYSDRDSNRSETGSVDNIGNVEQGEDALHYESEIDTTKPTGSSDRSRSDKNRTQVR